MVIDNGKFTTIKIFVETFYSKNYTESLFFNLGISFLVIT